MFEFSVSKNIKEFLKKLGELYGSVFSYRGLQL